MTRNRLIGGVAGTIALALSTASWAATSKGIEGSVHDLSAESWNTRQGVCSPCHTAHNTDPAQIAPLWSHMTSAQSFTMYGSPGHESSTLNAPVAAGPAGPSLACLSCHDGVTGENQSIGSTNAAIPLTEGVIGTDLHTTHPISFTYNSALATLDGALADPTTYTIGTAHAGLSYAYAPAPTTWSGVSMYGKTIDQAMLFNHKMECSSCHDVHKIDGMSPSSGILARLSGNDAGGKGSLLCRTCHIK